MLKAALRSLSFPIFLLFLCILSYGLLIPSLGFYWDDWPMAWFAHTTGPLGFFSVFEGDRPFLAIIYMITTAILDTIPHLWQIFALIARWSASMAVYWTCKNLWPANPIFPNWIAILFAIFPGFKQQSISIVYGNGFLLLFLYILSFGLTIKAVKGKSKYWFFTVIALFCYAICMFSTEYYLGLDLLRGMIIFFLLSKPGQNWRLRILESLKHWAPYLGLMAIFLIWRVAVFKFPTYQPELISQLEPAPVLTLLNLLSRIGSDIFTMGWLAWIQPFRFPYLESLSTVSGKITWGLILITFLASIIYHYKFKKRNFPKNPTSLEPNNFHPSKMSILLGFSGLLFAGWPFWITNLPIGLEFPYDRFGLSFMLGSSLLVVGLIGYFFRTDRQKLLFFSLLIAMAVGQNFENSNRFRREWLTLKDMFWQLSWRAPSLKSNTLVMTYGLPFEYYSDNSLTAPLNWTYAPQNSNLVLPYYLAFLDVRLGRSISSLDPGLPVEQPYRNAHFSGSTSNMVVYSFSPPSCLWVFDPKRDTTLPFYPEELIDAIPLSNPSQIQTSKDQYGGPPKDIFGTEPEHTWCYYYERAELARQELNWVQIIDLETEAFNKGFSTDQAQELLVFIEGNIKTGNWSHAIDLSNLAREISRNVESSLCQLIHSNLDSYSPSSPTFAQLQTLLALMGCPIY